MHLFLFLIMYHHLITNRLFGIFLRFKSIDQAYCLILKITDYHYFST